MKSVIGGWFGVALGLTLLVPAFARGGEIPAIDTFGLEARVSALIEETRSALEVAIAAADPWGQLGMVLQAHGLTAEAVQCYDQAIRRAPNDYRWPYLAAVATSGTAPATSAEYFAKAAARDQSDHSMYIAYADVLVRLGRNDDARRAYVTAQKIDGNSSFAETGLARLAMLRGDSREARMLLESARVRSPRDMTIHALLAQAYWQLGDADAARHEEWLAKAHKTRLQPYSRVVAAMSNLSVSAQAYERRGTQMAAQGDFEGAAAAYREVLDIRGESPVDIGHLATALAELGRHREAFALFDRALALDPQNVEASTRMASAYLQVGQLDRAEQLLERAVALGPEFASAQLALGELRSLQRRYVDAVAHYEGALTLDPSLHEAYLDLGRAHAANANLQPAVDAWERLQHIEPGSTEASRELAWVQLRRGRYGEAIQALSRAHRQDPTHAPTALLLARLLAAAPDPDAIDAPRALAMAMGLYRVKPHDASRADLLAIAYAANGDFDKAIRLGERAAAIAEAESMLAREIGEHLAEYRQGKPVRLPPEGVNANAD